MHGKHALVIGFLGLAGCGSGVATGMDLDTVDASTLQAGDRISVKGITAAVPSAGLALHLSLTSESGSASTYLVTTDAAGGVQVKRTEGTEQAAQSTVATLTDCQDPQFEVNGFYRWNKPYAFFINAVSTPAGMSRTNVIARIRDAMGNVRLARNNCGLPDTVNFNTSYQGTTLTRVDNQDPDATTCSDGKSVVGFGALQDGTVSVTCTLFRTIDGIALESDIELTNTERWFATDTVPAGCTDKYSVEAVTTHEVGHVAGLDHVAGSNLTMDVDLVPCNVKKNTLGLGDIKGLTQLYP